MSAPASNGVELPAGVLLFERGWLSSNNVLLCGSDTCALVDSGYATHAAQTLALVEAALRGRPLATLLNTHLHSDHCGGNAALQQRHPGLRTLIPPGQASFVTQWDPKALSYLPTGQQCPRFGYDAVLTPGSEVVLGDTPWQVHAAPGHDPDSVILFEPASRLLLSADALWGNGFGVIFPELDGADAFDEVADTLDLIESLAPRIVIPGHGAAFVDVGEAVARARKRLDAFVKAPHKHVRYAAKVLLKFKLLEAQTLSWQALLQWAGATELLLHIHRSSAAGQAFEAWLHALMSDLVASGAALDDGASVSNR